MSERDPTDGPAPAQDWDPVRTGAVTGPWRDPRDVRDKDLSTGLGLAEGIVRHGSAMLRTFGWWYHLLGLSFWLGRLRLESHSVERIRHAAAQGPIVYVLMHTSTVDHLALNTVLNHRRLPLSVFAPGLYTFWWQPVIEAWREVFRRWRARWERGPLPDAARSGWLARAVSSGAPVTLFLHQRAIGGGVDPDDMIQALLDAQEQSDKPIHLLPAHVVWDRGPDEAQTAVHWFVGQRSRPTLLGRVGAVVFRSHGAFVQVGEPVSLPEFLERQQGKSRKVAKLRTLLRRYLYRESHLVRGPQLLPRAAMEQMVLDNPPMRELAREEAKRTGVTEAEIRKQMRKDYRRIAANFQWWIIRLLYYVLQPVWTRIYAGVDIRDEDLERIRAAMRQGTPIITASHKSHFDYLLLSWVFFSRDLTLPHIAAGDNLAVFPLGFFLRRAGAFYLKRSFKGEVLFPAVFSRYLRELIRQGHPVEFFPEGGRSRTGKLLPPRTGLLGMVFDAARHRRSGQSVTVLPVSIGYERVAEAQSYARELGGAPKERESLGALVRARSVLRQRYGRVYMRVGEPLVLDPLVDGGEQEPAWEDRDTETRHQQLDEAAAVLMHRIDRVTVALPTSVVALALMAHHRRGLPDGLLQARTERFLAWLDRSGVERSHSLGLHPSEALRGALDRFLKEQWLETLEVEGERVWAIPVEGRAHLEYAKNQLVAPFAMAGLAAACIRAAEVDDFSHEDLLPSFASLVRLMRREYLLDPLLSIDDLLTQSLEQLVEHGGLTPTDGGWTLADKDRMGEVLGLVRGVLESYGLAARELPRLQRSGTLSDLANQLRERGELRLAEGELTRPEALGLVTVQHALKTLRDDGLLENKKGTWVLDEPGLDALWQVLAPVVRP